MHSTESRRYTLAVIPVEKDSQPSQSITISPGDFLYFIGKKGDRTYVVEEQQSNENYVAVVEHGEFTVKQLLSLGYYGIVSQGMLYKISLT